MVRNSQRYWDGHGDILQGSKSREFNLGNSRKKQREDVRSDVVRLRRKKSCQPTESRESLKGISKREWFQDK